MFFKAKKIDRGQLFKKAMLARREKIVRRQPKGKNDGGTLPWVSVLLWSSFLFVGGYIVFFSPALLVQEISVEGESIIPIEEYQAMIETELMGNYFGVLKKRNFFLIPTKHITEDVLQRYPKIAQLSLDRQFPDRLVVRLNEDPALLRWCSGGPCYSVRDGRAVAVPFADDVRYASVRLSVIDASALPVVIGEPLPIGPYLDTFFVLWKNLPKITAGAVDLVATTPSRHSGELQVLTGEGWKLLVSVERPADESLGALRLFLEEYAKEHSSRQRLSSVDLRVEGKIFYAEIGEPEAVVAP